MAPEDPKKDHWTPSAYQASASFVPSLTTALLTLLSPSRTDRILDLGCGDGILTQRIASLLPDGHILGLDSSPAMINAARDLASQHHEQNDGQRNSLSSAYEVADCSDLQRFAAREQKKGTHYDQIVSNAALHWILAFPSASSPAGSSSARDRRLSFFRAARSLLKPGGALVFECGAAGNVAETLAALIAGVAAHSSLSPVEVRRSSPWWFAGVEEMRSLLVEAGFVVEVLETEYRPTLIPEGEAEGGLEGWVRLMGGAFWDLVEERKKEEVVRWVCEVLEGSARREDGTRWLGYVRLRGRARNPE